MVQGLDYRPSAFNAGGMIGHQVNMSLGFSSKNAGMGCHFLLQWIFPTQGSNHVSFTGRQVLQHSGTRRDLIHLLLFSQSCQTLCHPMDCSTPGFPVLPPLLKLAQTHVHWVDDAIKPSHFLSSSSPPAFNLSQYQGTFLMSWLFTSGGQSIGASAIASVLPMNIQDWF